MTKIPHIVIIGAGISGLTLGWRLKQQKPHIKLTILEKEQRPGGLIQTSLCDGFLFERGPHSCRSRDTGVATLQLIEELGLQSELIGASPAAKKRFIYHGGRLHPLPMVRTAIECLLKEWRIPRGTAEDESVFDFFVRRCGTRVANTLIDPLVSGIYAGDMRQLSMQACFPALYRHEQEHGSLVKGMLANLFKRPQRHKFPLFTLRHGMEMLIHRLGDRLQGHLVLNCAAQSLQVMPDHVEIRTKGMTLHADEVFIALPAKATGTLVSGVLTPPTAVPGSSVAVINMGWDRDVLKRSGFGYLVPSWEKEEVLGVIWDSAVFPEQNRSPQETRLTVMLGGAHRPDLPRLPELQLIQIAKKALDRHLNIREEPKALLVSVAHEAIPQYTVGHLSRLCSLETQLKDASQGRIHLLGSAWYGVSVNDCVRSKWTMD